MICWPLLSRHLPTNESLCTVSLIPFPQHQKEQWHGCSPYPQINIPISFSSKYSCVIGHLFCKHMIHKEMTLTPELREPIRQSVGWRRLYEKYVGMSCLIQGNNQEVLIFEVFHTLWVDLEYIGTLHYIYQSLVLRRIRIALLRFKER